MHPSYLWKVWQLPMSTFSFSEGENKELKATEITGREVSNLTDKENQVKAISIKKSLKTHLWKCCLFNRI